MTESQFQAKLLKALRQHPALKDAVIFKHSDRVNGGIPDVSITVNGNTSWFELKTTSKLTRLQSYFIVRLKGFVIQNKGFGIDIIPQAVEYQTSIPLTIGLELKEAVNQIAILCVNK